MKTPWVLGHKGFTLVELLIVIVIIAILAAITAVAYNGINQRATNSSVVSTVSQATKLLRLYKTANSDYPITTNATNCLTQDNTCTSFNGTTIMSSNSDLVAALKSVGTLPASVPKASSGYYGTYFINNAGYTLNGSPNPIIVSFFLMGTNQDCTSIIGGMLSVKDHAGVTNDFVPAQWSNNNIGGVTRCYMMFP